MAALPAEIVIATINALTSDTQSRAYTYSPEVKATLKNLGLVNCAFYEWSNGLLYRRITVTDDQIGKLRATLSPSTPRAISLAKGIHSLRLRAAEVESNEHLDELIAQASALLRILAPNAALGRLFMDLVLPGYTVDLQSAVGSFTTLYELVLGGLEERALTFWMLELAGRKYHCLQTLRSLTVLDVNITNHRDLPTVFPQLTSIEELVIIRPWGPGDLQRSGRSIAMLFTPPLSLKRLTIILASGWRTYPLRRLKIEALGPAMIPYAKQVLILPDDPQETLMSWETIREKIGAGHKWETGHPVYTLMTTFPAEIVIAIINALTSDTQPGAYTYSSEVKATLKNLGLINWAFHEWSSGLLYCRVTVSDHQIGRLLATLSPLTPRAISLGEAIRSLGLRSAKNLDEHFDQASALFHILAPHNTLKRLFVDLVATTESNKLQDAIGSFTSLSELVLGGQKKARQSFWMIELAQRQFHCLAALRSLTILDLNITHHPDMHIVLPQLSNLEEFIVIRPWGFRHRFLESGRIFSELFTPPRSLKRLTIILASGWGTTPIQRLTVEDFGPAMSPYAEQLILLEGEGGWMSWERIGGMIRAGHQWGTG
ncbi:hypothetical protein FRB97_003795 [Tulasnella sp. 331]|nr:hypothetical protein FRB97_003795 [Tulasnella sp. 331]